MDTLFVKSNLPPNKDKTLPLAFYERDSAHPDEDAWVSGDTPVEVAETPGVIEALKLGKIVEVSKSEAKSAKAGGEKTDSKTATGTAKTETAKTDESDFEADFPERENLISQGVTTKAQLKAMKREDVLKLKGIGEAQMKLIAERLK